MPTRRGSVHRDEPLEVVGGCAFADQDAVRLHPGVRGERRLGADADTPGRPLTVQPAQQHGGQGTRQATLLAAHGQADGEDGLPRPGGLGEGRRPGSGAQPQQDRADAGGGAAGRAGASR